TGRAVRKPADRGDTSMRGTLPELEGGRGEAFYPSWPTGRSSTVVVVVTNTEIQTRIQGAVADARASSDNLARNASTGMPTPFLPTASESAKCAFCHPRRP